jgi:hypothetical protein
MAHRADRSARRVVASVDALTLAGGAVGDAARWADLLLARAYLATADTAAAQAALQRRPYLDGWPRYRSVSLGLEAALGPRPQAASAP